jgi:hypothetical protein
LKQELANEKLEAAEMNLDALMSWGGWGAWAWMVLSPQDNDD